MLCTWYNYVYYIIYFSQILKKKILIFDFSCSLTFNSTSFTFRRIILKICIKQNLKFGFSSQKRNKPEVYTIRNKCAMAHEKKNVAPKIHSEKALEAERVNFSFCGVMKSPLRLVPKG